MAEVPSAPVLRLFRSLQEIVSWTPISSIAPTPFIAACCSCETVFDLESKKNTLQEIEDRMARPGFWDNQERAQLVVGELKSLRMIIKPLEESLVSSHDLEGLLELAGDDPDAVQEVRREIEGLEATLDDLELRALLNGPHDGAGAIMSINARDGGTDANDWAEMLQRMYTQWAQKNDYSVEIMDRVPDDVAGIQSVTLAIRGPMAYGYLKGEMGIHRLVRISPFNSEGKRQTSFAAIDVSPEIDDSIKVEIDPEDVREDVFRASGAGGQHVNKTSSAIRLTHIPTEHRRAVPERTEPTQEPGVRLEDAPRPHGPRRGRKTRSGRRREVQEPGSHGLRVPDPQLLPAPRSTRQGRPLGFQRHPVPRRARRQHPRLPRRLPPLARAAGSG